FFQAEDGIRDLIVTGVQTCALPISSGVLLNNRQEALHYSAQVAALLESRAAATVTLANLADMAGFRSAANGFLGSDISGEKIAEIGRASCRERGESRVGAGVLERVK